jgi:hypothetical protein
MNRINATVMWLFRLGSLLGFLEVSGCAAAGPAAANAHAHEPSHVGDASNAVTLERMPEQLETDFALSALPRHLRNSATVYLLDPQKGYVLGRKGQNAWSCIVERTEWRFEDFRNDVYTPLCYDAQGAAHHLKVWFDVAELRAKGLSPTEVRVEMEKRFDAGAYTAPTRPGFSFMVAPLMRTRPSPDPTPDPRSRVVITMSMPHVMYYAPNLTDSDIGPTPAPSPFPFIFEHGPQGYMIQLLGEKEKADILASETDLLKRLCGYRSFLCIDAPSQGAH